jgi:hypothetical protein
MIQRLRDALRGLSDQPPNRQFRPNELRREVIREERLRRETRRVEPVASRPQLSVEEQRARRAQPSPALAMPTREAPPRLSALATRSGLRQAWLLKEILGPPLALRDPRTGGNDH